MSDNSKTPRGFQPQLVLDGEKLAKYTARITFDAHPSLTNHGLLFAATVRVWESSDIVMADNGNYRYYPYGQPVCELKFVTRLQDANEPTEEREASILPVARKALSEGSKVLGWYTPDWAIMSDDANLAHRLQLTADLQRKLNAKVQERNWQHVHPHDSLAQTLHALDDMKVKFVVEYKPDSYVVSTMGDAVATARENLSSKLGVR